MRLLKYVNLETINFIRDWSLITGWGGLQKRGRGDMISFTPTKRGWGGKRFSHADRGAQKVLR